MHSATAAFLTWQPENKEERDAVLRELERVLQSPQFCNSKRYPALLRFVVLRALAGEADTLKERTLGVEVFNRSPTYDTNSDTVVRYTAGEVRKRLSLFYVSRDTVADECQVQISLPSGSYVPEFTWISEPRTVHHDFSPSEEKRYEAPVLSSEPLIGSLDAPALRPPVAPMFPAVAASPAAPTKLWLKLWLPALVVVLVAAAAVGWHKTVQPDAVAQFWSPLFREKASTIVCSGGVIFSPDHFSGTSTAGKDIDYPFVSMQIASAITKVSGVLGRGNVVFDLQPCTSAPLSQLRDHPVVLLGGYNNTWTLRLLSPLRFQFAPEPGPAILDREHPGRTWARDRTLPYSNSDDYALVARFRDATTGGLVIVLAGLGRNGTEAAAQFATSPAYMQLLRDRVSADLGARNLEAVLKIHVVDGKTGAPTLLDVHVW